MILLALGWGVALLVALPFLVLSFELAAGLARGRGAMPTGPQAEPSVAVVMPAHNEAAGIGAIIDALGGERSPHLRLLVVADNCSDETAAVAGTHGATVIERHDPSRRGKGHALAFGRDWLRSDPPDCVIVLDADCTVEPGTLARLAQAALGWGRPVQGCYLLRAAGSGPMVQISNFAFLIKNLVRQRGGARLGTAAVLGGTGMAFPWPMFRDAPLATSDLVEDLALGVSFAAQGRAPRFLPEARIWSEAAGAEDTLVQRTRWEHGFLATARRQALPLVMRGLMSGRIALLGLGLHLLVPPLALLMTLGLGALVLLAVLALFQGGVVMPLLVLAGAVGVGASLLVIAWWREGRDVMPAGTLLRIPLYLAWKLPVYLRLLYRRQTEWVRTERRG